MVITSHNTKNSWVIVTPSNKISRNYVKEAFLWKLQTCASPCVIKYFRCQYDSVTQYRKMIAYGWKK